MEERQVILLLGDAIKETFNDSDWTKIGYLTGIHEWINGHARLLRSLRWGDDDYEGHVLDAVARMLKLDPSNQRRLTDYGKINDWLKANRSAMLPALIAGPGIGLVDEAPLATSSEVARAALADAQSLLGSRGPTSAVDRIHTGFHGYLRACCAEAGLPFEPSATAARLLGILIDSHPALAQLGPRTSEMRRVLRAGTSIVDTLGTLRNHASLAHPNEELLDGDEALLVINVARSLMGFLDRKLGSRPTEPVPAQPPIPPPIDDEIPF